MFDNAFPMYERPVAKGAASVQKLSEVAARARPVCLAAERVLPVLPALFPVLPNGLPRGLTLMVEADCGAHCLAFALIAGASQAGSWTAAVGPAGLGVGAAAEMGVAVERLLLVRAPAAGLWPTVLAALLDSFDLVLVDWPGATAGTVRRLAHRARERRSTLIAVCSTGSLSAWREPADLRLRVAHSRWQGLDKGHGRLACRLATVEIGGRRSPRPHQVALWLPGPSGAVELAAADTGEQQPVVVSHAG